MENDLQNSFETVKGYMTEVNQENSKPSPTDKEVWEHLKSIAELRIEEAVAEDVEWSEKHWQMRLKLINLKLKELK